MYTDNDSYYSNRPAKPWANFGETYMYMCISKNSALSYSRPSLLNKLFHSLHQSIHGSLCSYLYKVQNTYTVFSFMQHLCNLQCDFSKQTFYEIIKKLVLQLKFKTHTVKLMKRKNNSNRIWYMYPGGSIEMAFMWIF